MSIKNKAKEEAGKIGHTPGPWVHGNKSGGGHWNPSYVYTEANGIAQEGIAQVYRIWTNTDFNDATNDPKCAEGMANARLIAASPDLYEACKKAQALLNDICRPAKGSENMPSLMSRGLCVSAELSAAIYKATNGVSQ